MKLMKVAKGYDTWSISYDSEENILAWLEQRHSDLRKTCLQRYKKEYSSCLDIACATGRHLLEFENFSQICGLTLIDKESLVYQNDFASIGQSHKLTATTASPTLFFRKEI